MLMKKLPITPACISRCMIRALCGRVITKQPSEQALANPRPAMAYTRCWQLAIPNC